MQTELKLSQIVADEKQPRKTFDAAKLRRLADSIKSRGLRQPIVVERTNDKNIFLLVDGERRFRAMKMLGEKTISAIIEEKTDPLTHVINQFHIQEQHENWSPVERAIAIHSMSEQIEKPVREVSRMLGIDPKDVDRYIAFSSMIARSEFEKSELSLDWARLISYLKITAKSVYKNKLQTTLTRSDEKSIEQAAIRSIKNGFIRSRTEIVMLRDSFNADPKSIERFIKTDVDPRKLIEDSDAHGERALRQLINLGRNMGIQIVTIKKSKNLKITDTQKYTIHSLINRLKEIA